MDVMVFSSSARLSLISGPPSSRNKGTDERGFFPNDNVNGYLQAEISALFLILSATLGNTGA